MAKIQTESGRSLADIYDVEGSIVGLEELDLGTVVPVHEMGAEIFAERYSQTVRRMTTAALPQSTAFDVLLEDFPIVPTRVLGVSVFADADRVLNAGVYLRSPGAGREIPIFGWDSLVDLLRTLRMQDNGGAVGDFTFLVPRATGCSAGVGPSMLGGANAPHPSNVRDVSLRGTTSAFGAGDVTVVALVHIGFGQVGGISSRGLPLPGW